MAWFEITPTCQGDRFTWWNISYKEIIKSLGSMDYEKTIFSFDVHDKALAIEITQMLAAKAANDIKITSLILKDQKVSEEISSVDELNKANDIFYRVGSGYEFSTKQEGDNICIPAKQFYKMADGVLKLLKEVYGE